MIFIDSNIPMYFIGAEHPNKYLTQATLGEFIVHKEKMVTNVEVLQEIVHRYASIRRKEFIQQAFDFLYSFVEKVFDLTEGDALQAKDLVLRYDHISARDAVHAAQMKRLKIETIFSFDTGFDILPGLKRIPA